MPRADLRRARRARLALSVAESQARHWALVSSLPDGAVLQDAQGTVLLANPRACELLGITNPDSAFSRLSGLPTPAAGIPRPRPGEPDRPASPNGSAGPAESGGPDGPDGPGGPDGSASTGGSGGSGQPDGSAGGQEPAGSPLAALTAITVLALRTGMVQHDIALRLTREGRTRLLNVTVVPLFGDDGQPQAAVSSLTEATGQLRRAAVQRLGEEMFRRTMQHSPIGIAITTLSGRFLKVNRNLCRNFGYRHDELSERTLFDLMHPDEVAENSTRIGALLRGDTEVITLECRYVGRGDMQLWGLLTVTMIRGNDGRPLHLIAQIEDVTELHTAHDLVTRMTLHDPLTGLGNRALLHSRIRRALDRSRRGDYKVAVLQCDVDHFKLINDSGGYQQGDAVLLEIGRRVSRALRGNDVAGRLGGDEFVVVCEDVADDCEAVLIAERLRRAVNVPLTIGSRTLLPTVSVGIAISGSPDADPLTLLRDADLATYRAKERGRDRWDLVDSGLRRRARERLDLEQALRTGIAAGELELHFQPIVDVRTRAVIGREALVRWNHPERGLLAPMLFLPVAEESGLIVEIGDWVLAEATRTAAAAPDSAGYVAVNVSPNQVTRPGLSDSVQKALAEAGLPAERLVIELTESVMLSTSREAQREIEQLDEFGVRIVVDDFGTGFSALSYLRDLPVSGIKVDRSFTAGLGTSSQCERIVEALTGLGRGLGVDVIVEGVETEQQRSILASIGAEHAQGYLFGRPGPAFGPALGLVPV